MKVLLNIFRLVSFFGFGAIYTVWPVRLLTTLIFIIMNSSVLYCLRYNVSCDTRDEPTGKNQPHLDLYHRLS